MHMLIHMYYIKKCRLEEQRLMKIRKALKARISKVLLCNH